MASGALMSHISALETDAISPEMRRAIELELEAICNDAQFRTSQRNCAFLRYVIQETLAGRADEIKERTLGRELFGRPISYDTGSDAVVRVRANELRKRLICYYETHRSQAGWRLHLPLRTYVPEFVADEAQPLLGETKAAEGVAAAGIASADLAKIFVIPAVDAAEGQTKEAAAELVAGNEAFLPLWQMMVPTFVALFLCVAAFRWQAAYGTPYLDFWEALLSSRSGVAVVLDADPADPHAVTTSDLAMVAPLLQTVQHFRATTAIASSASSQAGHEELLTVHITHRSPANDDSTAAYVTVIPGDKAQLWVGSDDTHALNLAIHSISNADLFPAALQVAVRRNTPTRFRLAADEQVTALTLPFPTHPGDAQW